MWTQWKTEWHSEALRISISISQFPLIESYTDPLALAVSPTDHTTVHKIELYLYLNHNINDRIPQPSHSFNAFYRVQAAMENYGFWHFADNHDFPVFRDIDSHLFS